MKKINKIDYYCGAFLSYLVSNEIEPTLFEAGKTSKILEFLIKETTYKAYLKYSTAFNSATKQGKEYKTWNITFTQKELAQIKLLEEDEKKIIVVCICTDEDLDNTDIAVLDKVEAYQCLGIKQNEVHEQRRISIRRIKHSRYFECYGTGIADCNPIRILYDIDKIFGFNGDNR